ncbi:MAG: hypothetical protein HY701_14760, partial [Gemmatimonadetes bacterium]|nr:hypothetical protein [Gemmatimonadota bacterium]
MDAAPPDAVTVAGSQDMPVEDFRRYGHQVVEWVARYLEDVESYPVLSSAKPGQLRRALPQAAPSEGEPVHRILEDFERLILPGITHWNHPGFFGYFAVTGSGPGILGEMLCAG